MPCRCQAAAIKRAADGSHGSVEITLRKKKGIASEFSSPLLLL
jgi:hypothetical protein